MNLLFHKRGERISCYTQIPKKPFFRNLFPDVNKCKETVYKANISSTFGLSTLQPIFPLEFKLKLENNLLAEFASNGGKD